MTESAPNCIGVMTSGGDAQGMNAAVRGVVRAALSRGIDVYGIWEGYQGMVDGDGFIRKMGWRDVSGILEKGGTVIGTARCKAFRERDGRRQAAKNLVLNGIDNLVCIGGDGSLTGANQFREEWPELLKELVKAGEITEAQAKKHGILTVVGLVGSIDNDMANTDMTIGADSALHRIVEAIDAISSTAASHQRTFVVEVMGRHCGYLALMSAIATGAEWVLIPEDPPGEDWEDEMCGLLQEGRMTGRRDSIVVVAEGAIDRNGKPITSAYVQETLEKKLGMEARVTILGHVQRGGVPSAFDRCASSCLGYHAVETIVNRCSENESFLIGMQQNRFVAVPLMESVHKTHAVANAIEAKDFDKAKSLRGASFGEMVQTFKTMAQAMPGDLRKDKPMRLAIMTAGWPAPGMNAAVQAAVRLGMDLGHTMLAVDDSFEGLVNGQVREFLWMEVEDWEMEGGSHLGANRYVPRGKDFHEIAKTIENHDIDGILMLGGWTGYLAMGELYRMRETFPAFDIPLLCLPASINNNLPATEYSLGCDTALNTIVAAIDKIKNSADSARRTFIVEVMGRYCGYLAALSGLATGSERVYLHEEGVTLDALQEDVAYLVEGFKQDRHLGLVIRNEMANPVYPTNLMQAVFEAEGQGLYDVRQTVLGPMQQGGSPTPFDRIQATRMAAQGIRYLIQQVESKTKTAQMGGLIGGKTCHTELGRFFDMVEPEYQRPKNQWWLRLIDVVRALSR